MRVPLEIQKFVVHFCSILYRAFFFAETYAKKDPRLRGETGGTKREEMEWGSIAPDWTSATFIESLG